MLENSNQKWRNQLKNETTEHSKKGTSLNNNDIADKLNEVLKNSNALLMQFVERVIGKDRALVFDNEFEELNKLLEMQAKVEQKIEYMQQKNEQLVLAKKNYEKLKAKTR